MPAQVIIKDHGV